MIDLHCHLLPGVDDGARTLAQSVAVLDRLAAEGVTDVCLTPHLLASQAVAGPPAMHDEAFAGLAAARSDRAPRLHRGAEVMLDRPLSAVVGQDRRVTLAGTRYLLVEFPRLVAREVVGRALARVVDTGLIPLLAHPERYSCCTPDAVATWREAGSCIQVDATTLLAARGRGARARALVREGLADLVAADNHGDGRSIAAGRTWLVEQGGARQADLLTRDNPAAVLADRAVTPVPPLALHEPLLQRLRRLWSEEEL